MSEEINSCVENTTEEEKELSLEGVICEPLTWERINAIPVATPEMSTEQLRQICVDEMNLQLSFGWTPNTSFTYWQWRGKNPTRDMKRGTAYGGLPYISYQTNSIYRVMHLYDEKTGVLDTATLGDNFCYLMGNQCSGTTAWGWARVSTTIDWSGTEEIFPTHGAYPIGDYTYEYEDMDNFYNKKRFSADIIAANGEEVVCEAYAKLQPADGIMWYRPIGGHVQMATRRPVVVRNEDGTIDREQSHGFFQDQQGNRKDIQQKNGTTLSVMAGIEHELTFKKLLEDGYLPFEIAELSGRKKVERSHLDCSCKKDSVTYEELQEMEFSCNYIFSDLTIRIFDKDGNEIYKGFSCCQEEALTWRKCSLAKTKLFTPDYRELCVAGNSVQIDARIGSGELLTAYKGNFKD